MKTFKLEEEPNKLYFQAKLNQDEREIFEEARECLDKESDVSLSQVRELPYIDEIAGKWRDIPFLLALDLNYGTELFCDNPECLTELEIILNQQ